MEALRRKAPSEWEAYSDAHQAEWPDDEVLIGVFLQSDAEGNANTPETGDPSSDEDRNIPL